VAEIVLNNPEYFRSGESWPYAQVGNALSGSKAVPSVVRYSFTAPPTGARSVSVSFTKWYLETGNRVPLRFFIGTDPEDHIDADGSYPYTGELTVPASGPSIDGSGDILLLPGKAYYLWVFPSDGNFGIYSWENAEAAVTASGSAGGARIGADKKLHLCAIGQPDGSKKLYLPCVYDAAAGKWKLQS
jgi:hypothetical protein